MTAVPLLEILLAGLRADQPEQNCYLCLTSDDPRDVCATHRERLQALVSYPQHHESHS
jgi:hypothetical protein